MTQDAQAKLWKDWISKDRDGASRDFAYDGIIDSDRWTRTQLKILFILREPSQTPKTPNRSMCEFFLQDGVAGHFLILAEIAWGMQELEAGYDRKFEDAKEAGAKKESFLKTAFINIRKLPGGAKCDFPRFEKYAELHAEDIINQIRLIAPQVVICCGTFDVLKRYILSDLMPLRTSSDCFAFVTNHFPNTVFLVTCHSQASKWKLNGLDRKGNKAKYDDLLNAYKEYIKCRANPVPS